VDDLLDDAIPRLLCHVPAEVIEREPVVGDQLYRRPLARQLTDGVVIAWKRQRVQLLQLVIVRVAHPASCVEQGERVGSSQLSARAASGERRRVTGLFVGEKNRFEFAYLKPPSPGSLSSIKIIN